MKLLIFILLISGVAYADTLLSPNHQGTKPPNDLLDAYRTFVDAARAGDVGTLKRFILPGAVEVCLSARDTKTREYGQDINKDFMKEGFVPLVVMTHSESPEVFTFRTGSSAISFAKIDSIGWRIYRYIDKPIE
jgi:hypothetical protein